MPEEPQHCSTHNNLVKNNIHAAQLINKNMDTFFSLLMESASEVYSCYDNHFSSCDEVEV